MPTFLTPTQGSRRLGIACAGTACTPSTFHDIPHATSNLLLKHSDATLATFKGRQLKHLKYGFEKLAKTSKNT
jgi:hypothetical protein